MSIRRMASVLRPVLASLLCLSLMTVLNANRAFASEFSQAGCATYFKNHQWNELTGYCQQWTKAEPGNWEAWYSLGNAYGSREHKFGMQNPEQAAEAYKKSVQLNPRAAKVWNALGHSSFECGNKEDSLHAFQKATQLEPNNAKYWNSLGSINGMGHTTNDATATAAYNRAEKLGSKDAKRNNAIIHAPIVTTTNGWNFSPGANTQGGLSNGGLSQASYNYYHQLDHNGAPLRNP